MAKLIFRLAIQFDVRYLVIRFRCNAIHSHHCKHPCIERMSDNECAMECVARIEYHHVFNSIIDLSLADLSLSFCTLFFTLYHHFYARQRCLSTILAIKWGKNVNKSFSSFCSTFALMNDGRIEEKVSFG